MSIISLPEILLGILRTLLRLFFATWKIWLAVFTFLALRRWLRKFIQQRRPKR